MRKNHKKSANNVRNSVFTAKSLESQKVKEGILVDKLKEGNGPGAVAGKKVSVDYRAFLTDGTEVDSSYEKGEVFTFTMGRHQVIPGWEHGMIGMKVGEVRRFKISPEHAYGEKGHSKVPPNSTIVFEVTLLKMV
ncbi:MAG: FKBP-type peptidyl-prolyl cis-trans isomerase [Bacteriovoracaceae bacterium]